MSGKVLVGNHEGVYVIRFEGDVRLTLCASLDHYFESMLNDSAFKAVLVDLGEAIAIDSTSLGVLAKLSISVKREKQQLPTLLCVVPDILRVLENMGFDEVFNIVDEKYQGRAGLAELPVAAELAAEAMRQHVIESHQVLMQMNEHNHAVFKDLVTALEDEAVRSRCSAG